MQIVKILDFFFNAPLSLLTYYLLSLLICFYFLVIAFDVSLVLNAEIVGNGAGYGLFGLYF